MPKIISLFHVLGTTTLIFIAACGIHNEDTSPTGNENPDAPPASLNRQHNPMGIDVGNSSVEKHTLEFSSVKVPISSSARRSIISTEQISIDGQIYRIGFQTLLASAAPYPGNIWGQIVSQKGHPIVDNNGYAHISDAADFSSLLQLGDKLFNITQFEDSPGAMYLSKLSQDDKGRLHVDDIEAIDWSQWGGLWNPCAGSVTPWQSHLGSEEYAPDARITETYRYISDMYDNERLFLRYFDIDVYNPADNATEWQAIEQIWSPYRYGFVTEVKVDAQGRYTTQKHYAMGRASIEMAKIMPDHRTVYYSDDGTNVGFFMFVADKAADFSAGRLYALRWHQTSPASQGAGEADISWIDLGHASKTQIDQALAMNRGKGIRFSQIWQSAEPLEGRQQNTNRLCPDNFRPINTYDGFECLRLKEGMQAIASRLETRRYAAYLGATTEFRKEEGIAFDPRSNRLFVSMSQLSKGMEDNRYKGRKNEKYDRGGANHIKVEYNPCGAVYALQLEQDNNIGSDFVAKSMRPLIEGKAQKYHRSSQYAGNRCNVDAISNPDNITFMPEYNTLIIGEDSSRHLNNMLWAYNLDTKKLTRIATLQDQAETTSAYWHSNIGGFGYITLVSQHAYDGKSYLGVLGPFPAL